MSIVHGPAEPGWILDRIGAHMATKRAWTDIAPKVAAAALAVVIVPLIVWGVQVAGLELDVSPLAVLFGAACATLAGYFTTGD